MLSLPTLQFLLRGTMSQNLPRSTAVLVYCSLTSVYAIISPCLQIIPFVFSVCKCCFSEYEARIRDAVWRIRVIVLFGGELPYFQVDSISMHKQLLTVGLRAIVQ